MKKAVFMLMANIPTIQVIPKRGSSTIAPFTAVLQG